MFEAKKIGFLGAVCAICLAALQLATLSLANAQTGAGVPQAVLGGFVKSLTGSVSIRRGTAGEVQAKAGDLFGAGAVIQTGPGGEVVLLFADGQNVTLGKDTVFRIDVYQFNPANPKAGRASFVLVSGTMRMVTGAIHTENPSALHVSAGKAAISILSKDVTAFVVIVDSKELGWASAAVTIGQIAIETPSGKFPLVATDQFVRWRDKLALTPPQPLAAAPAVFQAIVAAYRASVQEASTPIDIQSGAVQAALSLAQATGQGSRSSVSSTSVSGQLNLVSGSVFLREGSGPEVPAKIGDVFGPDVTIRTGSSGKVGLLFVEGQYAVLSADSVFRIAGTQTDTRAAPGNAPIGLVSGKMSFVSWAAAPVNTPGAMSVAAGTALIAIVGSGVTAFVVEVDGNSQGLSSAAVSAGEISLRSADGPPIRIAADQFTTWQLATAPRPPQPLSAAPAQLQFAFTVTLTRLPQEAEVAAELASLPATAAGPGQTSAQTQSQTQAQAQPTAQPAPVALVLVILPAVSPGGGGGCTGSPC